MKNRFLAIILGIAAIAISCKDDEGVRPTIDLESAEFTAPEFSNDATGTTVLEFDNAATQYEEFEWSAADYGVSIPVEYTIEADVDATFSNPTEVATGLRSTSYTMTVNDANGLALEMGLIPFEATTIYMRVTSEVEIEDTEALVSTSIERTLTPYVTEFESIYAIGAGVGGWDWALANEIYGTGPSTYSAIIQFIAEGDANFRFLEVEGDWTSTSYNYDFFASGTVDPLLENNMDGDTNFKFVGTTGYYRVTLDLKAPSIVLEYVSDTPPELYMVGSGVPAAGWDWTTPVQLTWIQDGVFEATTEFAQRTATEETAFRFFTVNGDWNSGLNYPHYADNEYEIDSKLFNAMDGDQNFALDAESGTYKIVVNDIEKTITLTPAGTAGPPKYLVGDATDAGWDWASPVELVQVEEGIFKGATSLSNTGAFRVFSTNGDWGSGTNYPTYITDGYTIDPYFADAMDGDNNFSFTGPEETYVFVLNENDKTITLEFPSEGGDAKYLVGDATQAGWDWASPVVLNQTESGVFKGLVDLTTTGAFRVFSVNGDWNSGVNYPTYSGDGYTIDANFEDAMDGDNNFSFTGTDGRFIFILNDNDKTITLVN